MTTHRLLYLNTHRLSAYTWRQGRLFPESVFEISDAGLNTFTQYLQDHPKSRFSLLANVAEEGHILESIPFLRGRDRAALITRKISQHFSGTSLTAAISLGYEKNKRKNEKLLISALTNPSHFEPWLSRIKSAEAPLVGVFTTAQLGGQLLKKLGFGKGRCLLLTLQDHSIRESYLIDGQALFSRMAVITDSSIAGVASSFSAEAGKLHQYLIGQRQVGRDETLPVFIIAHPSAIPAIEKACPNREHLDFSIVDSQLAAKKLGSHTPPEDSHSEYLFLHLLATAAPSQQFASEPLRHDYHLTQIRQGLIATGLIAVIAGSLVTTKKIYEAHTLRNESHALLAAESDLNWRYQEISSTFPQLGIDNETLRRITNRHVDLSRQQRLPSETYINISRALNQVSAVFIESIEWKVELSGASTTKGIQGDQEVTVVRGAIRAENSATPRQILGIFEQFITLLERDSASAIHVQHQPFELKSENPLRGGDNEDGNGTPREFMIEIVRKIVP